MAGPDVKRLVVALLIIVTSFLCFDFLSVVICEEHVVVFPLITIVTYLSVKDKGCYKFFYNFYDFYIKPLVRSDKKNFFRRVGFTYEFGL